MNCTIVRIDIILPVVQVQRSLAVLQQVHNIRWVNHRSHLGNIGLWKILLKQRHVAWIPFNTQAVEPALRIQWVDRIAPLILAVETSLTTHARNHRDTIPSSEVDSKHVPSETFIFVGSLHQVVHELEPSRPRDSRGGWSSRECRRRNHGCWRSWNRGWRCDCRQWRRPASRLKAHQTSLA